MTSYQDQFDKDLLKVMPPSHARNGLSKGDILAIMTEVERLRTDAAILNLWEQGHLVIRRKKGKIVYCDPKFDPCL